MNNYNQKLQHPVNWTSKSIYVDIDTGEQITKWNAKKNYLKIKTDKHAKFDKISKTKGTIEYTIQCRRNPQQELPFTGKGEIGQHTIPHSRK